jgi:putative sigma-54 modulation protein
MRISVKGRNLPVSDELREHVARRFNKISRQVSELAELEMELYEERNPAIADSQVAEATLHLKGTTLRARDASPDMTYSINLVSDELSKQVKRHRDKRRKRREARAASEAAASGAGAAAEIPVTDDQADLGEPVVEGILLDPDGDQPAGFSSAA